MSMVHLKRGKLRQALTHSTEPSLKQGMVCDDNLSLAAWHRRYTW
jgi:hypothetical protein